MSETKLSNQLETKIKGVLTPSYGFLKLDPNSGNGSVNISATGSDQPIAFHLPADTTFNLAESILAYDFDVSGVASKHIWLKADTPGEIKNIELLSTKNSSNKLGDIPDANVYSHLVRPRCTSQEDLLTLSIQDCLYASNEDISGNYTDVSGLNIKATKNYIEKKHCFVGPTAGFNTHTMRRIRFGQVYPDSLFSYNKDIYSPEMLKLIVTFSGTRIGWLSDSKTDPSVNTASLQFKANPISNLCLYLAVEKNDAIHQNYKDKVMKGGMKLYIPYIHRSVTNLSGSRQTVNLRIDNTMGLSVKKIIHSVFNDTQLGSNVMYDHNNWDPNSTTNGAKIIQYYTKLNDNNINQFTLRCGGYYGEDYLLHRNRLKGSCINSPDGYNYHWFHEEDFTHSLPANEPSNSEYSDKDNLIVGHSLEKEIKYDWVGESMVSGTYNHYDYILTVRVLTITPNLIVVQ